MYVFYTRGTTYVKKNVIEQTLRIYISTKICSQTGGIYILHHLGFRVRIVLDRGAVDPLPMLNMPGVEGLKVGAAVIPKLRVGAADGVVKLNPVVAENRRMQMQLALAFKQSKRLSE